MGDTPTPVNNTANAIDNAIQVAVFDVAVNALKAYAVAALPWLGWPIISQAFNWLLNLLGNDLYGFLSQLATFEVITIQTGQEEQAYLQAIEQLQAAYSAGNSNGITSATQNVKTALASLIHFDGWTSISGYTRSVRAKQLLEGYYKR